MLSTTTTTTTAGESKQRGLSGVAEPFATQKRINPHFGLGASKKIKKTQICNNSQRSQMKGRKSNNKPVLKGHKLRQSEKYISFQLSTLPHSHCKHNTHTPNISRLLDVQVPKIVTLSVIHGSSVPPSSSSLNHSFTHSFTPTYSHLHTHQGTLCTARSAYQPTRAKNRNGTPNWISKYWLLLKHRSAMPPSSPPAFLHRYPKGPPGKVKMTFCNALI